MGGRSRCQRGRPSVRSPSLPVTTIEGADHVRAAHPVRRRPVDHIPPARPRRPCATLLGGALLAGVTAAVAVALLGGPDPRAATHPTSSAPTDATTPHDHAGHTWTWPGRDLADQRRPPTAGHGGLRGRRVGPARPAPSSSIDAVERRRLAGQHPRSSGLGRSHYLAHLLDDHARLDEAASHRGCRLRPPRRPALVFVSTTCTADRTIDLLPCSGHPHDAVLVIGCSTSRRDLPGTVRDAILARTAGLDPAAWELLHLLTSAPEAIPDRLLVHLAVGLPPLRALDQAGLIRRASPRPRVPPRPLPDGRRGDRPARRRAALHRRLLDALEAAGRADPAVLAHHAVGAGDPDRIVRHASAAGRAAARSGAHTQAAAFFLTALELGATVAPEQEAELLELLAAEHYLLDRLPDAIAASERAMRCARRSVMRPA